MPEIGERETTTVYPRIAWLLIVVNLSVPAFVLFQRNGNNLSDAANIWVGWISATFVTAMLVVGTYLRLPWGAGRSPEPWSGPLSRSWFCPASLRQSPLWHLQATAIWQSRYRIYR